MNVTLRAGTKHHVVLQDGTLSAERVLDEDTDVTVGDLGEVYNCYENAAGETVLVRVENEVR